MSGDAASEAPAIELREARAERDGHPVLGPITLRIEAGERVALLGANGAGKSTLIDVLLGLVPTPGEVRVLGRVVQGPGEPGPRRAHGAPIGLVAQDPGASLLPWLSARENVELPLRLRGLAAAERTEALESVRAALDPHHRIDLSRAPRALSGGERQLVALLRAFVGAPRLIVLDEPLSAVDPRARVALREAIARACERAPGTTLLFISHDLADVAAVAGRAIVLAGQPARVVVDRAVRGDATELERALAGPPPAERAVHAALGDVIPGSVTA